MRHRIAIGEEEIDLFCDIAAEGGRSRADAHGVRMKLKERIARENPHGQLKFFDP